MRNPIGPLLTAGEGFCHQIVDTMAATRTPALGLSAKDSFILRGPLWLR